jgi:nucleoside 2-deoxyribosyltransferase
VKKIYLAGPDVFAPDAREIGRLKVAICGRHGLHGIYPLDVVDVDPGLPPGVQALAIYDALERAMHDCAAATWFAAGR